MSGTIIGAVAAVLGILVLTLFGLVWWLSGTRKALAREEARSAALERAKELDDAANKVMAEPVAHEPSWLVRARRRAGVRKPPGGEPPAA